MKHLEATQQRNFIAPSYFVVKFNNGDQVAVANWQSYSKEYIGAGLFLGPEYRQTCGTGDLKIKSLSHLLRKFGRKASDVKSHNFPVI